jgi:hypothetical protein
MRGLVLLIAIGASACEREPHDRATVRTADSVEAVVPAPASKPAPIIARPSDQAQLDRLILAGYTPHADHLHAPGVNECPLTKGTDAVM